MSQEKINIDKVTELLNNPDLGALTASEALEYVTTILASAYYNLGVSNTEQLLYYSLEVNAVTNEKLKLLELYFQSKGSE